MGKFRSLQLSGHSILWLPLSVSACLPHSLVSQANLSSPNIFLAETTGVCGKQKCHPTSSGRSENRRKEWKYVRPPHFHNPTTIVPWNGACANKLSHMDGTLNCPMLPKARIRSQPLSLGIILLALQEL